MIGLGLEIENGILPNLSRKSTKTSDGALFLMSKV